MTTTPPPEGSPATDPAPDHPDEAVDPRAPGPTARRALNEDWAATIAGLAILLAVLVGLIPEGSVP